MAGFFFGHVHGIVEYGLDREIPANSCCASESASG